MSCPLACHDLAKHFGTVHAVDGVNLEVEAGTVTGLLGPNGSGKTTLLRLLTGLLRPTRGRALLAGLPAGMATARRRLGFMPADPTFTPALSGRENLDVLADVQGEGSSAREWALDLLALDGLDRPVREYSGGMVQKLAIVQAVQHQPTLVILDEPANRLDPISHHRFEEMVRALARTGTTVFLSSHTLSEVEAVCDRVVMIRRGRVIADGPLAAIAATVPRHLHARYSTPPAALPDGLLDARLDGATLDAHVAPGRVDILRALLADPLITDLTVEPPSLEDAFLERYREGGE